MRISVIGTGYLGAVHAACMAELGHQVLGVDADPERIAALASGRAPFFEDGLDELLRRGVGSGRLRFGTSLADAGRFGQVHFICVGTPQRPGSLAADTTAVEAVLDGLAPHLTGDCLVVGKSTVPVGTSDRLAPRLAGLTPAGVRSELAWNPEFLREGHAVDDTLRPDRLVAGVSSVRADALLRQVYEPLLRAGVPYLVTDPATAELAKTAANAFLATKISFINAMAEICDAAGADASALSSVLGYDGRIGHAGLSSGLGYGGGCLPKDIRALLARGTELGAGDSLRLLAEVERVNAGRRTKVADLARELCGGSVRQVSVAVLGAAFKANTDDVRDSPALAVATSLHRAGARVRVHDPRANASARRVAPELEYSDDVLLAAQGAELVLHLTDWSCYRDLDPAALRRIVRRPVLIDARNNLPLWQWRQAGWVTRALGAATGGSGHAPAPYQDQELPCAS